MFRVLFICVFSLRVQKFSDIFSCSTCEKYKNVLQHSLRSHTHTHTTDHLFNHHTLFSKIFLSFSIFSLALSFIKSPAACLVSPMQPVILYVCIARTTVLSLRSLRSNPAYICCMQLCFCVNIWRRNSMQDYKKKVVSKDTK